ncbi:MAG: SDR family oxidoreductase [Sulfurovum sp.]|nr:SDR family oxidoreductase [Sulfurovaceae bacterium]
MIFKGIDLKEYHFENKNIVITGAGTGYGQALTIAFLLSDANVFLVGRRLEKLNATIQMANEIKKIKSMAYPIKCDIVNSDDISLAISNISSSKNNSIDILINCAAVPANSSNILSDISENQWDNMMNINLKAQWFFTKSIFNIMTNPIKRVLFFTSGAAWSNTFKFGLYNISKAALNSLSHSLAKEYAIIYPDDTISINCINPGEAKTEMNQGSHISAFEICEMVFKILDTKKNIPNGYFFHRNGKSIRFCNTQEYNLELE